MATYSVNSTLGGTLQSITSTYISLISLNASNSVALKRFTVGQWLFATNGAPNDNVMQFDISRITAAGTATGATPVPNDPADAASLTVGFANYTAEPTVTTHSSLFNTGANQRATIGWTVKPGKELVAPATNLNGFAFRGLSPAYVSTATAQAWFDE